MINLKKIVVLLLFLLLPLLCGCESKATGAVHELTDYSWSAKQRSGSEVTLTFTADRACLAIVSPKEVTRIEGKYLASDKELVIFMPQIAQTYGFSYTPRGKLLDLHRGGATITLKKK